MRDKNRGSVTVEATISLTAFMFAILTLLMVINVCLIQAKMSIAIDCAAKELSKYSYIYSLTGFNQSEAKIGEKASGAANNIEDVIGNVNTVFSSIQDIGQNVKSNPGDISGILSNLGENFENIGSAGGELKNTLESIAKNPKELAMGLVKMAAVDTFDYAKSRLIAEPLAKVLTKKNLVDREDGEVEDFLRVHGVVPKNGSYASGLDFSDSTLFLRGSNEIKINVKYKVKLISFLPVDISFNFNQTAVTHGWMAGDKSYKSVKEQLESKENSSIWTDGTIKERNDLIITQGLADLKGDGYERISTDSFQYVQAYSEKDKEFVAIHSMNPLYSESGEPVKSIDDINENVIREQIEIMCNGMLSQTKDRESVDVKRTNQYGDVNKQSVDCKDAGQRVIIVVPEDENLSEKIQNIAKTANTKGVTVEIKASYGNGARATTVVKGGKNAE